MKFSHRITLSSAPWWLGRTLRSDTKPQFLEEQNYSTATGASHIYKTGTVMAITQ